MGGTSDSIDKTFSCKNYILLFYTFLMFQHFIPEAEKFLGFSKAELCEAEPQLTMCHTKSTLTNAGRRRIPDFSPDKKIYERLRKDMLMNDRPENPFDEIGTRSPPLSGVEELFVEQTERPKKHFYDLNDYYRYRYKKYYQTQQYAQNSLLYRVYPGLHPKNSQYCPNMRGMFAYTCQPSKPLRVDLVEFCKDYSAFCNVPNFHRLPGPRLGPPIDRSIGHVGVSGKFGLGVGALPGFDVGVGSGVDVGPIPGLTEDVGVGLGLDVGVVGAKSPEAFRRGQDNPNEKGGGVVGISGGVGVKAPGAGDIGVGSGIGVGK